MSQPYKSGRQQNLNLGITSITENKTVLQTIGKVGIGTTNAQNHSLFVVGTTNITGDINVGGASTFVGVGTFRDSLYVQNQLYVGGVSITGGATVGADIVTRNLQSTGITTLSSSGGITTTGGNLYVGDDLFVKNDLVAKDLYVTGVGTIKNFIVPSGGEFDVYDTTAVFHNNVRIDGNLSIGGTSTIITAQDLRVYDKDIVLGIATDAFGNDITTDTSANHGGIAIASTEGSPLVDLSLVGFSTLPATYKQLMWVAKNSYGVGTTDAWHFNYAVGIGSTLIPNGVRFAVKGIQFTDTAISAPNLNLSNSLNVTGVTTLASAGGITTTGGDLYIGRDLYIKNDLFLDELNARNINITGLTTVGVVSAISVNATGIITAYSFRPSSGYYQSANGTNSFYVYNGTGNVAFQGTIGVGQINSGQGYQAITLSSDSKPTITFVDNGRFNGVVTARQFVGDINAGIATISQAILTDISASTLNVSGLSTFAGITTVTGPTLFTKQLNVSGVSTFGANAYFGDSDVLNFGDGNDLQIYHDGANSVVRDVGTGSLILQSDGVGVDIYNITQGEYQARFKNNGPVELYYDNIKRLETTGYGITVYNTIQAPQLNITGIGTIDGITISSGIVTSSQPGITTIKYYGDGSNLFGVNAFNVINQVLSASPVYPTFANQIGVTSIGIADTEIGFIPSIGNLGIGSTNPTAKLQVVGNVLISGVTTARQFVGAVNAGVATVGLATITSGFIDSLTAGIATVNKIDVNQISPDGINYGGAQYILRATGTGTWEWADVPGIFSVNNILNGFSVSEEGIIVGTAGSITQIDFRGNNIIASANPQPNGIATVRVSDTPIFDSLNVTGLSTFAGITTVTGSTLFAKQLSVSGLSTFIGVGTFVNDLYVGGSLFVQNDLVFDEFTARNINVTGISTLGTASATTLVVSGISTFNNIVKIGSAITAYPATGIISATAFYGDGSNLANTGSTLNAASGTQRLVLTSQTTGTMTQSATTSDLVYNSSTNTLSATNFAPTQLRVTGVSTFSGPVSTGSSTGITGQYLQSTGVGVTWATFPTLRTTQTNVATSGQTLFSFGYNVNFLDVFVNGVKLTSSEYTATNGSSITLNSPAFANDIIEFVSYNTTSAGGGGGGATILDDLTDVVLTLPPAAGETLTYNGSNWVNDYAATASTSTTSQTVIHTLSSATYRSVEYMIQATQGLKYHLTKILVVHDGLLAYPTEYGIVYTIDSLGTFDVDISGGNIRLLVTPSSATTTDYKIKFTAIKV